MKHIQSFNESWWNRRKYFVDRIDDENVEKYDYDKLKKITIHHMKLFNRYILLFTQNTVRKKKNYYFDLVLENYKDSVVNLYRIFKLLTKDADFLNFLSDPGKSIDDEWFNESYRRLSFKYHGTKYHKNFHNINHMINISYFLNRINFYLTQTSYVRYFYEIDDGLYQFYDKIKYDKERDEHKDIDPFDEENWNECD